MTLARPLDALIDHAVETSASWQIGDVVACYGRDAVSRAITWRTSLPWPLAPQGLAWGPAHVALILRGSEGPLWAEATTLCARPCLLAGRAVEGFQAHRVEERISDYVDRGGSVQVYRLAPQFAVGAGELDRWHFAGIRLWTGRDHRYDMATALLSGTRWLSLRTFYPAADVARLFCSEYVGTVLQACGRMCVDENASRHSPASLLRRLVRAGTYRRIRSHYDWGIKLHAV